MHTLVVTFSARNAAALVKKRAVHTKQMEGAFLFQEADDNPFLAAFDEYYDDPQANLVPVDVNNTGDQVLDNFLANNTEDEAKIYEELQPVQPTVEPNGETDSRFVSRTKEQLDYIEGQTIKDKTRKQTLWAIKILRGKTLIHSI